MTAVTVALIAGLSSVIVGIFSYAGVRKSADTHAAVTDTKLEELTREVRKHNEFAERIPVIENNIVNLFHRYDELNDWKNKLS